MGAVATLIVVYLVSSAAANLFGGAFNSVSTAVGGAGKAAGGAVQTAVQAAAPSLDNMGDPFSRIENQIRSGGAGQDPATLRDAATSAMRAVITGDPSQQAAARDRAADALAKAQNISSDEAKARVSQLEQQYTDAVAQAKEKARQAADTAATAVSRGALYRCRRAVVGCLSGLFCRPLERRDADGYRLVASSVQYVDQAQQEVSATQRALFRFVFIADR